MANEVRTRGRDLAFLCLRIGLGVFFIDSGWAKVENTARVVALWERLHLPLPHVFGPIHAAVEFGGAILLFVGLFTRAVAVLLAADMLGALFLVKIHTTTFISQEWLALWMALALLFGGAGALSLDSLRRRRRQATL